ncbi:MAG TPA: hypothetical protein VGR70_00130 [Stellaceae bacterium]|nr:hypothetical protein [Stellaceae bacterium]
MLLQAGRRLIFLLLDFLPFEFGLARQVLPVCFRRCWIWLLVLRLVILRLRINRLWPWLLHRLSENPANDAAKEIADVAGFGGQRNTQQQRERKGDDPRAFGGASAHPVFHPPSGIEMRGSALSPDDLSGAAPHGLSSLFRYPKNSATLEGSA